MHKHFRNTERKDIDIDALVEENAQLRERLEEAEATINAVHAGEIDAVVVAADRDQIFTLEEPEKPYRLIVEQMPAPAATMSCDGRIIYCNQRFAALLGEPQSSLVGKQLRSFIDPHDESLVEPLLEAGSTHDVEAELSFRDAQGARIPLFLSFSALDEGVLGRCVLVRDQTEQKRYDELKRTQAALRSSEERLDLAQRAGRIGSFEWTRDGNVSWSSTMEELYGVRPGSFSGSFEEWCNTIHPDDRDRVRREMRTAMDGGGKLETQYRVVMADGSDKWLVSRGKLLYDENGKPKRLVGVSMDVTESQRLGQELREADKRKDEFLATLAHELRNPLAPIRNAVQILKTRDAHDPEIDFGRDVIDRQVQLMVRLIDDLLDVSRISRGKLQLRKERVSLSQVLEAAFETSRPAIEDAECEFTLSLPSEKIILEADAVRISQVFANLLNNAAKYNHLGGKIVVSAQVQGGQVVVSVKDSGIGIESEVLPFVFEMFSQVSPSHTATKGGLGIGLSLVKGLVELHGGTVAVRSEGSGTGSEFIVRLPIAQPEDATDAAPPGEERVLESQHRILIVDDNHDSADTLAGLLSIMGNHVQTAYDGAEALRRASEMQPEVILLDIGMPKMNGYEVCSRIRQQEWGRDILIVALTGWGQEEDRRRSKQAGFSEHLVKPVDPKILLSLITERGGRSGQEVRNPN